MLRQMPLLRIQSGCARAQWPVGWRRLAIMQFEYSLSGKWLELLKQVAPGVSRAAIFRDPTIAPGIGQFAVIQAVAPSLGIEVSPINTNDAGDDIEHAVSERHAGGAATRQSPSDDVPWSAQSPPPAAGTGCSALTVQLKKLI